MRDVVIIGGGLTGLAAALELESLKIPYRMIEVKNRLGGSIATQQRDGFTFDTGAFAFPRAADWSFLAELGLEDALIPVNDWHLGRMVAFKNGTQMLTDALVQRMTGTVIHRMAVSSLGDFEGHFALCMENGLMWEAGALIVTSPARHVERMFRTLVPEFSLRLLDYHYDTITRVAVGFPSDKITDPGRHVWGDIASAFYYTVDHPDRVPPGYSMIQMGVRFPLERTTPEVLVRTLQGHLGWPENPALANVSTWAEADPIPPHSRNFRENMIALENLLPDGVALAGSDFNGLGLADRIAGGRKAARKIAAFLETKK
ncbi:MAG: FAD-dependent oxidoreductase [Chloroflexota bacterium]